MKPQTINFNEKLIDYQVVGVSMATIEGACISKTDCFGFLKAGTNRRVEHESIFHACSISKYFTSMLVMTLSEQGILDIDRNINEYLSSWKVSVNSFGIITLRHLLSHHSGIVDPEGSFPELMPMFDAPSMVEILEGKTPYCDNPIEVKYKPGSEFSYSDAGFCVIQLMIEDIMGESFEEVMEEYLFLPLKLNNSTFQLPPSKDQFSCGHTKDGGLVKGKYPIYPYPAASGLWTTPTDVALLVIEWMNAIKGESNLFSTNCAKEMLTPQFGKEWKGLGVFRDIHEKGIEVSSIGWGVGFQGMMVAFPNEGEGLVIMTNTDTGVHQLKGLIGEVYRSYY
ncbi:serine hydrolase domain-containing protein [Rossellomorea vietnamensis]|uniref:Penicillin-binding protein n=1 Tax=Rossellomorea vietnamensis TaxID=218284 RepID=A0A0N8GGL8_9BACI|nr:serine hydrolase domain-containing protein [Rossellomorea vietnamensis]KPL58858.1 penicillin-binding protein [Rossellomorea vietnamensis]